MSTTPVTLILLDNWRAAVIDGAEGIVVLDVTANSEAEAKGRAHTAAEFHLNCKDIKNIVVRKHVDMPQAWLHSDVKASVK